MSTDADRLKQFLRHLPQTDRYILLLSYADGLTPREVAAVLDLPELSVEGRLTALKAQAETMLQAVHPTHAPTISSTVVATA